MGLCARGTECTFAHSHDEVKEQQSFFKSRLCQEFTTAGFCENGDRCKFAHGMSDLRHILPVGPVSSQKSSSATSSGAQRLLQAMLLMQQPGQEQATTYESAAFALLLKSTRCSSVEGSQQQITDDEDWFGQESLPLSRQSTCYGDCSLPAFSRNTTESPVYKNKAEKVDAEKEFHFSESGNSIPSGCESPPRVVVKNSFIHVEATPTCLRRVCSAPGAL